MKYRYWPYLVVFSLVVPLFLAALPSGAKAQETPPPVAVPVAEEAPQEDPQEDPPAAAVDPSMTFHIFLPAIQFCWGDDMCRPDGEERYQNFRIRFLHEGTAVWQHPYISPPEYYDSYRCIAIPVTVSENSRSVWYRFCEGGEDEELNIATDISVDVEYEVCTWHRWLLPIPPNWGWWQCGQFRSTEILPATSGN